MTTKTRRQSGFTIVELLCVIGAIAILLGFLLVGLQAAGRMSKNVQSMSRLRQLHVAWTTYSNAYNDRILPGYLDEAVQSNWRVRYNDSTGGRLHGSNCTTYPWRILPYLSYDLDTLSGYRRDVQSLQNDFANPDLDGFDASHREIARTPAFGANAYYVGGWFREQNGGSHLVYGNTPAVILVGDELRSVKGRLVATNVGQIPHADSLIAFCSSTFRGPGAFIEQADEPDGSAWVVPQRLCDQQIWRPFMGDVSVGLDAASIVPMQGGDGIEVLQAQAVPLRRHGISIPLLHCDGNTGQSTIEDLLKMDRWIPAAIDGPGRVDQFAHECDP